MIKTYQTGHTRTQIYPITRDNFPPDDDASTLVNPKIGDAHGMEKPSMPGDVAFEKQVEDFLKLQEQVRQGKWPYELFAEYSPREGYDGGIPEPLRDLMSEDDIRGAARMVVMDHPMKWLVHLHEWVLAKGYKLKSPEPSHVDFLGPVVDVNLLLAQRLHANMHMAFEAKSHWGRLRPAEYFARLEQPIPEYLIADAHHPHHTDYPQGHISASSSAQVLEEEFDMPLGARIAIFDSAYVIGQLRAPLGVHWLDTAAASMKMCGYMPPVNG